MRRTPAALVAALLLAGLSAAPASAGEAQAPGCDVESATLDWGFKESFRAYVDGSIANGEWTVADGATYATPTFGFPGVDGRVDPRDPNGSVSFGGSVRFTGHGGILDTTVANPVLVLRGDGTGLLLLDVSGPTMEGDPVAVTEAPFLALDLAGQDLVPVDGVVTIDAAPATLTEEGAAAFPNYPEGEAFDPVSATIDLGDCDLTGQPIGTDTLGDDPSGPDEPAGGVVWVVLGTIVVAAALVAAIALIARRRR